MKHGLGRIAAPDPRDHRYLLSPPRSTRTSRFWWGYRNYLDQGPTPQCTAFAWAHFYVDSPVTHSTPFESPAAFYVQEQALDGYPTPHDGSTVRAGAQVMVDQHHLATEYRWAFDMQTVINCILEQGPLVVGTDWFESMFDPVGGFVRIEPGSHIAGGHAYKLDGVNVLKRFFRIKNSWGKSWGNNGFSRVSFDDFERLLLDNGEACVSIEA